MPAESHKVRQMFVAQSLLCELKRVESDMYILPHAHCGVFVNIVCLFLGEGGRGGTHLSKCTENVIAVHECPVNVQQILRTHLYHHMGVGESIGTLNKLRNCQSLGGRLSWYIFRGFCPRSRANPRNTKKQERFGDGAGG